MVPVVVKNSRIPKLLSIVIDVYAITLWPFVFIRDEGNETTIRHETIHIKQYSELLVFGFYLLYFWDWIVGLIKYKDKKKAYYRIRFEQEAYSNHRDVNYLVNRKRFSWAKYKV